MKLESLRELFIEQCQDLYSAENMIIDALPKMIDNATAPELKSAFTLHLEQTRGHVLRLDQVFSKFPKIDKEDRKCKGMEGLIKEGKEMIKEDAPADVKDAGLIAAAQRVEHYEIAAYGCARTYAHLLGMADVGRILQQTLDEEGETDKKLTAIAERINIDAKAA